MVWLTGFFYVPSSATTSRSGRCRRPSRRCFSATCSTGSTGPSALGVGIAPNLTARSMQGSWPFWAAQRPADGGGLLPRRILVRRLPHRAAADRASTTRPRSTPTSASSASPPRTTRATWRTARASCGCRPPASSGRAAGLGDLEHHDEAGHALRRLGRPQPRSPATPRHRSAQRHADQALRRRQPVRRRRARRRRHRPEARLRRCSRSTPGFKYRGFSFQGEYYVRQLSDFLATGPLPLSRDRRQGISGRRRCTWSCRRSLGCTLTYGHVFDDFERKPWEISGGASFYPERHPQLAAEPAPHPRREEPGRVQLRFYTAGQTGTTISLGTDILL